MTSDRLNLLRERLLEMNEIVVQLDESIRLAAFALLEPYVLDGQELDQGEDSNGFVESEVGAGDSTFELEVNDDGREFLGVHDSEKPSDNVRAIAAYLYSIYGSQTFTVEDVKTIAASTGLTIPERVDKTLVGAKNKKKTLFIKVSSGVFRVSVHGEQHFKERFAVAKGTHQRAEAS